MEVEKRAKHGKIRLVLRPTDDGAGYSVDTYTARGKYIGSVRYCEGDCCVALRRERRHWRSEGYEVLT